MTDRLRPPGRSRLTPAQQALVRDRLRRRQDLVAPDEIPRRTEHGSAPLSFGQEALWFLSRLQMTGSAYHVPQALRLRGALDESALEKSLSALVSRHEALRTTFVVENDRPVQRVLKEAKVLIRKHDLGQDVTDERKKKIEELLRSEATLPFDLSRGPLFRASLLRLGNEEHILQLTLHHIISDGWSLGVLNRELSTGYNAFRKEHSPGYSSLPIQYADFCSWQRTTLQSDQLATGLTYWAEQLSGAMPHVELPLDHPRPPAQTFGGAKHWFQFTPARSAAIRQLARNENVSVYTVLLAALNALLYRYTGQEDIVLGGVTAGRSRPELEDLVGFFANTIAFRTDLTGQPTFRELLARTREMSLAVYTQEDVPFNKVVEALQPTRDPSRNPVFQIQLVDQGRLFPLPELDGLEIGRVDFDLGSSMFDLTVFIRDEAEILMGSIEYNTDLFKPRPYNA